MSTAIDVSWLVKGAAFAVSLLIAMSPGAAAQVSPSSFPLACSFGSRTTGLDDAAHCAADTAAGMRISPAVLSALAYEHGLASIAIARRGWFYLTRDGRSMRMMTFDMGPDYFREGLARALIDGKLAYVDRRLRVQLRTRYDWGEPFVHGRANVCIGCVEIRLDGGEHSVMTGGRWGTIDRRGREVVSVILLARPRS